MELRPKAYLAEVEKALDNLASVVKKVEKEKVTHKLLLQKNIMLHYQIYSKITVGQGVDSWDMSKSGADTLRKCRN